jgi:hypothetical protein
MVVVLSFHAVTTTAILWQDRYYYLPLQELSARNKKLQPRIKPEEHTHLWCEQLIEHKSPQCAPANLETSCLLEIGDVSRKLRLHCSCQFLWCVLALRTADTRKLRGNSTVRRLACSVDFLSLPWVALQLRCRFLNLRCSIQFHVFNSVWLQFLDIAVACFLSVPSYILKFGSIFIFE